MQISQSNILTTKYMNKVFDKTVATYKYYWFLGFFDLCIKCGNTRINECMGDYDYDGGKRLASGNILPSLVR